MSNVTPADRTIVSNQIEARLQRYIDGGFIKDLNHGGIVRKVRGMTTRSSLVTDINVQVAKFAIMTSLREITGMTYEELFKRTDRELMGDDGLLQLRDFTVDPKELQAVMWKKLFLKLTIKFNSVGDSTKCNATWAGCCYLSHNIMDPKTDKEGLLKAGIVPGSPAYPPYLIQYNPVKWRMRQTVALQKQNIFRQYNSAISYLQKSPYIVLKIML